MEWEVSEGEMSVHRTAVKRLSVFGCVHEIEEKGRDIACVEEREVREVGVCGGPRMHELSEFLSLMWLCKFSRVLEARIHGAVSCTTDMLC